ncbi:hypothetical protein FACS1894204_08610 [Synergistales bacterium]|nr:hypothetical protein FACS1894204_08610 [Synergistales bacterium]
MEPMLQKLKVLGYNVTLKVLQVADYGVPQFRRRLVLLAGKGFEIPLPEATHAKNGKGKPKWKTVREVIGHYGEPLTLLQAKKQGRFPLRTWHVVRDMSPLNTDRLKVVLPGETWTAIPEHLRPQCHRGGYKGFSNVYGRMEWDEVSPTITGGCTTLSKGRFGHPERNTTISVREAASLQTFPEDYIFDALYIDPVCKIIGNALPCLFAEKIAEACYKKLKENH